MKEVKLTKLEPVILDQYDGVSVERYLTYEEIQNIVKAVGTLETWSERQACIDMMVLYYATDIDKEFYKTVTHDDLLKSGLVDAVMEHVKNINAVYSAIREEESMNRTITKTIKEYIPALRKAYQKWQVAHADDKK